MARRLAIWVGMLFIASANALQSPDWNFKPSISQPSYEAGRGPVILIDEAHSNIHTAGGGYAPFAAVLRADGYRVEPLTTSIGARSLEQGRILVIANALSKPTAADWNAPPESAYTDDEIKRLHAWVRDGGSLFLVADHMPCPGSIDKLASAFGVQWHNGYAQDPRSGGLITFTRAEGSLGNHPITRGRNAAERIDSVMTFAGSAFQAAGAQALLTFSGNAVSWMPADATRLVAGSPSISVKGWQQGAVLQYGKGRIAVFGEAAMFTAQIVSQGPGMVEERIGMNHPRAKQNEQFLLNVVHWLDGLL